MAELVSCLCVSRPARWGQLQRAILDFGRQTYEPRELVVVVDRDAGFAAEVRNFAAKVWPRVSVFARRPVRTQYDGLQYAVAEAYGSVLAIWDDDNLNHPDRLAVQVAALKSHPTWETAVSALSSGFYLFHRDSEVFVLDELGPGAKPESRYLAVSLVAARRAFPALEPSVRGRPAALMLAAAAKAGCPVVVPQNRQFLIALGVTDHPEAENMQGWITHRRVAYSRASAAGHLTRRRDQITLALSGFMWDGNVTVEGADAGAFTYAPGPAALWPAGLYPVKVGADTGQGEGDQQ